MEDILKLMSTVNQGIRISRFDSHHPLQHKANTVLIDTAAMEAEEHHIQIPWYDETKEVTSMSDKTPFPLKTPRLDEQNKFLGFPIPDNRALIKISELCNDSGRNCFSYSLSFLSFTFFASDLSEIQEWREKKRLRTKFIL